MLVVETVARVRRAYFVQEKSIKEIARDLKVSRKTVRKVIRSGATSFHYARGTQPAPKLGPWRDALDGLLLTNAEVGSRAADPDAVIRGATRAWLRGRLRRRSALRPDVAPRALGHDRGCLRAAELRARRGVPVRLEPRGRADRRRDREDQGRARPALPLAHALRAGLSTREPGDGV